jgi:hypothetical protein
LSHVALLISGAAVHLAADGRRLQCTICLGKIPLSARHRRVKGADKPAPLLAGAGDVGIGILPFEIRSSRRQPGMPALGVRGIVRRRSAWFNAA